MTEESTPPKPEAEKTKLSGFKLEEFRQLHEHMRVHERAMDQLSLVSVTASATLISAIGIFYFGLFSGEPTILNVAISYLFLAPVLIVSSMQSAIRGHRESLFKIGLYIKVFLEQVPEGAAWHIRQEAYQRTHSRESQDSAPIIVWVIVVICLILFWYSLFALPHHPGTFHIWLAPLLIIVLIGYQHRRHLEAKKIHAIENAWREVKKEDTSEQHKLL